MIGALLLLVAAMSAPPTPYMDWGGCPFECCQYGKWTAVVATPVHASRSMKSRVVFTIQKGEVVTAVTGVVITTKPGPVTLEERLVTIPKKNVIEKGSTVHALHYVGEGYHLFWFRGETFTSDISIPKAGRPEAEWWIKVRTTKGKTGWINGNRGFDGSDKCGG